MMPLAFFRIPTFSAGNTVAFSVSLGMFSIFLFVTLYMQAIRGYTPLETGVRFLPMTVMIIVTAPIAGHVAQRIGPRIPMTYGLTMASAGLLGLTLIAHHPVLDDRDPVRDDGPRPRRDDGPDDRRRDGVRRSAAPASARR